MNVKSINQLGFTLIELIMVIVILGVLSAFAIPKFADLSSQATIKTHIAVVGSFEAGIRIARLKYFTVTGGSIVAAEDVKVYSTAGRYGTVDFNSNGWPAQSYNGVIESNPQTDRDGDCASVWVAIMQENTTQVSVDSTADYIGRLIGSNRCEYTLNSNTGLSFIYDSNDGSVIIDDVI